MPVPPQKLSVSAVLDQQKEFTQAEQRWKTSVRMRGTEPAVLPPDVKMVTDLGMHRVCRKSVCGWPQKS